MESFVYNDVHLLPQEQIGMHDQDSWELSYIITGAGTKTIGDKEEPFESGEVVLVPPHIPHCWRFGDKVTDTRGRISNISVMFTDRTLNLLSDLFPCLKEKTEAVKSRRDAVQFKREKARNIIAILQKMRTQTDAGRVPSFISLITEIAADGDERIVGSYTKPDPTQDRLEKTMLYLVCNFNREITLDGISAHVGMNRSAFCTFFKRAAGTTFFEYLNEYRIEKACRMLRQRERSISEICYMCGFNNVSYFNRMFKRVVGMSPSKYAATPPEVFVYRQKTVGAVRK